MTIWSLEKVVYDLDDVIIPCDEYFEIGVDVFACLFHFD